MIHVVSAIFNAPLIKGIPPHKSDSFRCRECDFTGNLEQAVAHSVSNQFVIKDPVKKAS